MSHSVIIGLSLGVSQSPCTIRPLVAALSFHQFFEGFALGGCISEVNIYFLLWFVPTIIPWRQVDVLVICDLLFIVRQTAGSVQEFLCTPDGHFLRHHNTCRDHCGGRRRIVLQPQQSQGASGGGHPGFHVGRYTDLHGLGGPHCCWFPQQEDELQPKAAIWFLHCAVPWCHGHGISCHLGLVSRMEVKQMLERTCLIEFQNSRCSLAAC